MKIFCTFLVLAACSAANAGLTTQFTPNTNPVQPGNTANVSVVAQNIAANVTLFIGINGPAGASLVDPLNAVGSGISDGSDWYRTMGMDAPDYRWLFMADLYKLTVPVPNMPNGVVVSGIQLLFEGAGTVEVVIFDPMSESHGGASYEYDRDTLTVIPEPITLGLLGIGGLFLRRRIA